MAQARSARVINRRGKNDLQYEVSKIFIISVVSNKLGNDFYPREKASNF